MCLRIHGKCAGEVVRDCVEFPWICCDLKSTNFGCLSCVEDEIPFGGKFEDICGMILAISA